MSSPLSFNFDGIFYVKNIDRAGIFREPAHTNVNVVKKIINKIK